MSWFMSESKAMVKISCSCVKSSLTNIYNLSDDILQEIFARLPSRGVSRCNYVIKRWLGLISDPSFIYFFICHQYSLYNTFLMFIAPHEIMLIFPIVFDESKPHPQSLPTQNTLSSLVSKLVDQPQTLISSAMILKGNVCGSSNGLILGCNARYTCGYGYYVYDPLSQECVQIPNPPKTYEECIYAVGFACESFDYTNKTKGTPIRNRNYRVVIIPSFITILTQFQVEVFSSETMEWKQHNVSPPNGFSFARHWFLSFDYKGWLHFMGTENIFVFNPYGRDSYTLAYPDDANAMNIMSFGFLRSSCGRLRISEIDSKDVKVWELQEDGKWQQIHQKDLSLYLPNNFCVDYHKRIGGLHPYDGDIVYLCSYNYGTFAANLRTNKFEEIPGYDKCDISPFKLEMPL